MKHTILFLAANPLGTDHVALDREARAIQLELERSGFRDRFELVTGERGPLLSGVPHPHPEHTLFTGGQFELMPRAGLGAGESGIHRIFAAVNDALVKCILRVSRCVGGAPQPFGIALVVREQERRARFELKLVFAQRRLADADAPAASC